MRLTPTETRRLLTFTAASFAREALGRGLRLSAPEAIAVITDEMHWSARAGRSYRDTAEDGRAALRPEQVLPGVPDLLEEIRVEPTFDEGPRLIILRYPLGRTADPDTTDPDTTTGDPDAADGTARTAPPASTAELPEGEITLRNTSPRVVRISSHYPLDEINRHVILDRDAARGYRLALPAGDLLRLAPGEERTVAVVPITSPRP